MSNYTADNIQVLNDVAHIRLRRGMYIGEAENPFQLLSEVFDNAVDEVQAGFSSELVVKVDTETNTYTVRDFGRGIPHGLKELENGEKKEVLEILITKSNSGGKFDNSSYNYSSGLNGLGLTITNALSKYITITSFRSGRFVEITSIQGTDNKLTRGVTDSHSGTNVEFSPDETCFRHPQIPIDMILNRCRIASALGFRARLFVDDKEVDTNSTIYDLMIEEDQKVTKYVDVPFIEVGNSDKEEMKVALRYTSDTNDRYYGYTNLLNNKLGGTHVTQLAKTIIEAWEEVLVSNKNIRPIVELRKNDFLIGLRAVCAVFISKPEFSSQTKEKLVVNKNYFDSLMDEFKKKFKRYLNANLDVAHQLVKRFEEYRIAQNNLLSRKEISSLIKVSSDDENDIRRRSVVSKLVECTSRKRDNTELFIVEGDSALGPYLYVRDKALQAVLPLRGKILNVTGKSLKEAVQNKEICDIANSMGCGIGSNCDASKSRYDRIVISADADPDGLQINCLVLAVFVNLFPDMVKQGRVFVSMPPLYCWGTSVKDYGWCSKVEDIPEGVKNIHRFKGLGEMQNDQLDYFLVNPKTRNIMQIEFPSDLEKFNAILGTSEGKGNLLRDLGIIKSE